jgi:hypothetical protein
MFDAESGGQVAWLLPAALLLLVAGLAVTWRTARLRAAFILWGGWLLVTAGTFSFMAGIYHAYYEVALAPAIGALVGMGGATLWRRRDMVSTVVLAVVVAVTAIWSSVLLGRSASFLPWLSTTVLVIGLLAAVALIAVRLGADRLPGLLPRVATAAVLGAAVAAGLAGPAAYALDTASAQHTGSIPTAGPAVAGARGGPGGGPGGLAGPGGAQPGGALPGGAPPAGPGQFRGPGAGGPAGGRPPGALGGPPTGPGQVRGPGGPGGGLLDATAPSAELTAALQANASAYTWAAAAIGSQTAAGYQLASGVPVMPIGGFNGSDPSPTLAQFQEYVTQGRIHYFLGGGGFQASGGSQAAQQIAAWVQSTFSVTTIGGQTVYDLTK